MMSAKPIVAPRSGQGGEVHPVTTYIARRLIFSAFVLWGALTVVFLAVRAVPGDPAQMMLGTDATAAEVDALREKLGLNRPLAVQYATYLLQTLRADLGDSLRLTQPVVALVAEQIGRAS